MDIFFFRKRTQSINKDILWIFLGKHKTACLIICHQDLFSTTLSRLLSVGQIKLIR